MADSIVCTGRPVDDRGVPQGEPCGRRYSRPWGATDAEHRDRARAAGWSVTGPPMCPACRKPDPAIARGLTTKDPHRQESASGSEHKRDV